MFKWLQIEILKANQQTLLKETKAQNPLDKL